MTLEELRKAVGLEKKAEEGVFGPWHRKKEEINHLVDFPRPKRRQIWWCAVGMNIGSEQSSDDPFERPVLVIAVFGSMFWGVPITSSDPEGKKAKNPLFYSIDGLEYENSSGEKKELAGWLAIHQMRTYDSRRLIRKMMKLDTNLFQKILYEVRKHI